MEANNKTYEVSTVLVSLFIDVGEGAPTGYTPTHENGLPILVRFADLLGRVRWDSNPNGFYCTSAQSEIEALKTRHRETWGKFPARGGCWKRI